MIQSTIYYTSFAFFILSFSAAGKATVKCAAEVGNRVLHLNKLVQSAYRKKYRFPKSSMRIVSAPL